MKNEPTPGPWRWGDHSALFDHIEDPRSRNVLEHNPTYPRGSGEVVRHRNDGAREVLRVESRDEVREADAELIRRAPELRDALLEVLRDHGGNMDRERLRELRALAMDPIDPEELPGGGEGMAAVFARLDAIGLDRNHPTHKVAREAIETKLGDRQRISDKSLRELAEAGESCFAGGVDAMLDGVSSRGLGEMATEMLTARELIQKLDVGIARITEALGFAPGGADFTTMVGEIGRLRGSQQPIEVTKGLLDALVLTPWGPPPSLNLLAGKPPEVTHVGVTVKGLPGFHASVQVEAFRELQAALEVLLGPAREPRR